MREVDYVIVGGGSAGCVLANRLSASPAAEVALLEAGGEPPGFLGTMPAGFFALMGSRNDWKYATQPDPSIAGRAPTWNSGKMLGGGSAINGMVYIRGIRSDYDGWATAGCPGWSFDDVLPYFIRAESYQGPASKSHGREGPLTVSPPRTTHPLTRAFVDACGESGLPKLADYCGGDQHGAYLSLTTMKEGQRASTAKAYLDPARGRKNLSVSTACTVDKLVIEGDRVVGVRYLRRGQAFEIRARREVILSAGAVGSPAVLLRSGIGPGETLSKVGIPVRHALVGVGRNLQEHPVASMTKHVDLPTYNTQLGPVNLIRALLEYRTSRLGMMTTSANQAMACVKSSPDLADPDIQLSFVPLAIDFGGSKPALSKVPGVLVAANPLRPHSRGEVGLRSVDPADAPRIEHRLLGDRRDADTLVRACRIVEGIFGQPALKRHVVGPLMPGQAMGSDDEWMAWVTKHAGIAYHPAGTCKMGSDEAAVVDSRLRVVGLKGLRIVDASVMPTLPSANTNAPTIMVAEKGAQMILDDAAQG